MDDTVRIYDRGYLGYDPYNSTASWREFTFLRLVLGRSYRLGG